LINELLIKAQSSSILDLALLSWALAESNFLEVIVLPKEKEIPLKKALNIYKASKSQGVTFLSKKFVYSLIPLSIAGLVILLIYVPLVGLILTAIEAVVFLYEFLHKKRLR